MNTILSQSAQQMMLSSSAMLGDQEPVCPEKLVRLTWVVTVMGFGGVNSNFNVFAKWIRLRAVKSLTFKRASD